MLKKVKMFENFDKMYKIWKYLEKSQVIAWDYRMQ